MIETIEFKGKSYPAFQGTGNASRFCRPFALEVCKGRGVDVGCMKKEWAFPGAIPVDLSFPDGYDAINLPSGEFDYIHSSHMLEHFYGNVADVLQYWHSKLVPGGVLFLYLPDFSQMYWRWWNNRKHIHTFTPEIMQAYFDDNKDNWGKVFISNVDAYNAFTIMAEKK